MCGAFAIRPPSASKIAQEKSSRSLMLTECAVDCRRTPICSATDMNRLLNTSSSTGSASVPARAAPGRGATRVSSRSSRSVTAARQPGSTTVVASSSAMIAGPSTACPARSAARRYSGTRAHSPAVNIRTCSAASAERWPAGWGWRAGAAGGVAGGAGAGTGTGVLAASTETASTTIGLSRIRKENWRR